MVMTILISPKKLISTKIMDHIDSPKKKKNHISTKIFHSILLQREACK